KGTAAVNPKNLPMHLRHRALFIGFAPAEDPRIAIAIAVEGGGYGGSAAAPIARKVFDAWLLGVMPEEQGAEAGGQGTGGNPASADSPPAPQQENAAPTPEQAAGQPAPQPPAPDAASAPAS